MEYYANSTEQVLTSLNVSIENGLSTAEATSRIEQYGLNELTERAGKSPYKILWEQFTSTMVLILIAAAVVSGFLGKPTETVAISAIVILFGILGFVQEYRAEQAMAALKKLTVPNVRIRRNRIVNEMSARDLVPGDIVLLEAGNIVPADLRLVESANLRIQEAALTGESEPVEKHTNALPAQDIPLGDRKNMGYMGTVVTYGRGVGVVSATGMSTELGKIATLIQDVEDHMTPLQHRLDQVGKTLALAGVIVAILVMIIGVVRGEPIADMFLTAVSVAVAVVPEGLPAVVTITLALGAQRMLRRNALVRKLPAVETLGSVTVICSDKTGTLTENRMTVTVIDVAGHSIELMGTGGRHDENRAKVVIDPGSLLDQTPVSVNMVLAGGALCNDASLKPDPETGRYGAVGDPTEGALLVAASQAGIAVENLKAVLPRVAELPFESDRKRMTTIHKLPASITELPGELQAIGEIKGKYISFTKGSIDGLMDLTACVWNEDQAVEVDDGWRERIQRANDDMAQNGMRVLGVGFRWLDEIPAPADMERDLTILGMIGMIDPPRPEVPHAVQTAKEAGIRTIMITGDHPLTARFIAHELGITENSRVKTGQNINDMTEEEFAEVVENVNVFARVSPEHKLRIVEALQKQGNIVAMTGDGVNDSPALKKSNIGIAMGITGTDVSKEASQIVLLDDNFATIVSAVRDGRVIYDNIRRFVKFSIAGNLGKVIVMLFAPLFGINVALLPLQLLWLNLLTDGLLGIGLGLEQPEKNTMQRPPRDPKSSILSEGVGASIVRIGVFIGIVALALGVIYFNADDPNDKTWQTMMFATLAFLQIGQAMASRSTTESFFSMGFNTNPILNLMIMITFALQLVAIYVPFFDEFFGVEPLSLGNLLIAMAVGSLAFFAIELEKLIFRPH